MLRSSPKQSPQRLRRCHPSTARTHGRGCCVSSATGPSFSRATSAEERVPTASWRKSGSQDSSAPWDSRCEECVGCLSRQSVERELLFRTSGRQIAVGKYVLCLVLSGAELAGCELYERGDLRFFYTWCVGFVLHQLILGWLGSSLRRMSGHALSCDHSSPNKGERHETHLAFTLRNQRLRSGLAGGSPGCGELRQ